MHFTAHSLSPLTCNLHVLAWCKRFSAFSPVRKQKNKNSLPCRSTLQTGSGCWMEVSELHTCVILLDSVLSDASRLMLDREFGLFFCWTNLSKKNKKTQKANILSQVIHNLKLWLNKQFTGMQLYQDHWSVSSSSDVCRDTDVFVKTCRFSFQNCNLS